MRSIFEDPGNRKALGFDAKKTVFVITIPECTVKTSNKDYALTVKSLLTQNSINFKIEENDII